MENNKKYRVAIVGCGAISAQHIPGILEAGNEICALCDIIPERVEAAKEKFGLTEAEAFTDYVEMFDKARPDAVHICTPHYLHAQMICAALERNINVLTEKPLAISMEQLREIEKAVKKSTAAFGVCLQNRYSANNIILKEHAEKSGVEAAFGDVVWRRDEAYYRSGEWRGKWATEGGGVMINQALHTLDLLQWICGMPDTVTAHCFNDHLKGVIEVEDTAVGTFSGKNGGFQIFATTSSEKDFIAHLRVKFRDKTLIHAETRLLDINGSPEQSEKANVSGGKEVWGDGHKKLIADYYSCLRANRHFPVDFYEGSNVIRLILSMYMSEGREVPVLQL